MQELITCFQTHLDSELYLEELEICKNYKSQKRIDEFKRGRLAAKQALAKLEIFDFPVLKSSAGFPIWPNQIYGSISHSENLAVAIVSKKFSLVGVDIEYKNKARNPKIFEKICSESELSWVNKNPELYGLQVFSAKEAIYKAFYLVAKLTFADVELSWQNGFFNCTLAIDINQKYQKGFLFKCSQLDYQDYLLSTVSI